MKKEKTVRTYQRRTKSGKMVTVHEHKASYNAAEEARKAAAKKAGAGSELSKKKGTVEESPLGFSAEDYKAWYHWDMEDDANNEAALRVEKALTKKMGKKAYNKYLKDMTDSYSARGHKKAHQSLLDEHTERQKKQDAEISKAAKDIARGAKEKAAEAKASKSKEDDGTSRGFKRKLPADATLKKVLVGKGVFYTDGKGHAYKKDKEGSWQYDAKRTQYIKKESSRLAEASKKKHASEAEHARQRERALLRPRTKTSTKPIEKVKTKTSTSGYQGVKPNPKRPSSLPKGFQQWYAETYPRSKGNTSKLSSKRLNSLIKEFRNS